MGAKKYLSAAGSILTGGGLAALAVPGLARLSVERIWMELKRLLEAPDPVEALALMAETGVLGAVLPEATPAGLVRPRDLFLGSERARREIGWDPRPILGG
mgnify:CR=1 FL=1